MGPLALLIPAALLLALAASGASARPRARTPGTPAQGATLPSARTLRVCADPNGLPASNRREEGFENRIARLVAADLGATLRYVWWPQRAGFLRQTLRTGRCDVVIGLPAAMRGVLATRPYYRSTYVFLSRTDRALGIRTLDDPRLRRLRIGVHIMSDDQANTPSALALGQRGMMRNVFGYYIYGDFTGENPPARLVEAVSAGDVDIAVIWGPLAGYFGPRQPVAMTIVPVSPQVDQPYLPFVYDIAMGVRRSDTVLQRELEAVLARRGPEITAILRGYGVPLLPLAAARRGATR